MRPTHIASAPGKLILCGEHAVVYGQPAIAIPLSALRARASVHPGRRGLGLGLEASDLRRRWRLADPGPLPTLLRQTLAHLEASPPDIVLRLRSQLPIASGMGSGAAIATALVRALAASLGRQLGPAEVSALVYESERAFHGTPSGIDNSVVAYERPIWFQRPGDPAHPEPPHIEPLVVGAPLTLVVGDSGVRSQTSGPVGDLRRRWLADPAAYAARFAAIGQLCHAARQAIERGDTAELGRLLDRNHQQLVALEISIPELDHLVAAARAAGALGAKLSGAGWGGVMLALAPSAAAAPALAAALARAGATRTVVTQLEAT